MADFFSNKGVTQCAVNEFSSKIVDLARNAPKMLKINPKCSKYHFKSLSEEIVDEGLLW